MKITIYELLGLVKDGKAPKKIKYIDKIFDYNSDDYRFWDEEYECYGYLTSYIGNNSLNILTDEIEILEEQKKIPEKLPVWCTRREDKEYTNLENQVLEVARKLDEIIDYLKSKGE